MRLPHRRRAPPVGRGTARPYDATAPPQRQVEQVAEAFHVVVHHLPLVHDGGVGDGRLVENDVEGLKVLEAGGVAEVGDVAGDDVAGVVGQVSPGGGGE